MTLRLTLLPGRLAVARLAASAPVPEWAMSGALGSVTRTDQELSIVAPDERVPASTLAERGFRCLRLAGPIPFTVTGVIAALTAPLAAAGISVFVVSTYDTDLVLVREDALGPATAALAGAGHVVES